MMDILAYKCRWIHTCTIKISISLSPRARCKKRNTLNVFGTENRTCIKWKKWSVELNYGILILTGYIGHYGYTILPHLHVQKQKKITHVQQVILAKTILILFALFETKILLVSVWVNIQNNFDRGTVLHRKLGRSTSNLFPSCSCFLPREKCT